MERGVLMKRTTVISVGGSIIVPDRIDVSFLKRLRKMVLDHAGKGNRVVIVTGGGKVCRRYNEAAEKVTKVKDHDKDLMGIQATKMNAELVRSIFGDKAYEKIVDNPTKKINTDKSIIIASGWKPGFSSDMDAVLLAKQMKADTLVNMSNITHVYDKDPKRYRSAKKLKNLSWDDMRSIVGDKWKPGANLPFDPVATKEASKMKLKVAIMGNSLSNLKNFLDNKKFEGSVVE